MIGLLTCLVIIALAGASAELVRAYCRRQLMTPLVRAPRPADSPAAPVVAVPAAVASAPMAASGLVGEPVAA